MSPTDEVPGPRIDVVVPARNEARFIGRCLEALVAQRKQTGLVGRIIVVDNGSTDATAAIAAGYPVEVIASRGTVAAVRNAGAQGVDAELIAFVDGDCVVDEGWSEAIRTVWQDFPDQRERLVFGASVDIPDTPTWIEALWFSGHVRSGRQSDPNHINSGNVVMASAWFRALGGFDPQLASSEDVDLSQRTLAAGGRLLNDPAIRAVHLGYPATLADFVRREFWHGKGMLASRGGILHNKALALAIATLGAAAAALLLALLAPSWLPLFAALALLGVAGLAWRLCRPRSPSMLPGAMLLTMLYAGTRAVALCWSVGLWLARRRAP